MVSRDGRLLGKVEDVLINDEDGRIIGYELSEHDGSYLRAEADLRTGRDLIVVPEDAVARDMPSEARDAGELPGRGTGKTRHPLVITLERPGSRPVTE